MNIVFFAHPLFLGQQSMKRFAGMLADGMRERGHQTEIWRPQPLCFNLPMPAGLRKWAGYVDQYFVFPNLIRNKINKCPADTLFVFTDQALGPWVPLVRGRPFVIHCHDFLAQRSARGEVAENRTSWTGRQYQAFIRKGYSLGDNYISVSFNTQKDLHRFIKRTPPFSKVVYNGLNQSFFSGNTYEARSILSTKINKDLSNGYILHVGGNQWYKNRSGVIKIYDAWRSTKAGKHPLLLIGKKPDSILKAAYYQSPFQDDIHFIHEPEDTFMRYAYVGALVLLFPSLAEGFGWPIAEAMASGCPVITTNQAPMTEVAGNIAFLIPRRPNLPEEDHKWAQESSVILDQVFRLSPSSRKAIIEAGILHAKKFDVNNAIDQIENFYQKILRKNNN